MSSEFILQSTSKPRTIRLVRGLKRIGLELRKDPVFVLSGCVLGLVVLMVVVGPLLAPYSPAQTNILNANQGLSSSHWLGTDEIGRDVLSRLLYGARPSLIGAGLIALFGAGLGTAVAIVSVWFGGWTDRILMRFMNILFAIPSLLYAVVAVAVFGVGLTAPIIALAVAYSPYFARVGRSVALQERNKAYVDACVLTGFSSWRICMFHLFPNMRPIVLAQLTVNFGFAILDLAALSFIGLGVQPPAADWGLMISNNRTELLDGHPWVTLFAGAMIVISVVASMVFGERLTARAKSNA